MFPNLQKKLVRLYTWSTGLILTFILAAVFLFYLSLQENRQKSLFQDHLFTLTSALQSQSTFSDSYLAQMEIKNRLLIYIEENDIPFFFPGSYEPKTDRDVVLKRAAAAAEKEGIYPNSHPISSAMLQSSVFSVSGDSNDRYIGTVIVLQTFTGYKRLVLLQDITENRLRLLETGAFYLFIDLIGILFLFFTGKWFVCHSLKPLEETYQKQQDFVSAASHELRSPLAVIQTTTEAIAALPSLEDSGLLQKRNHLLAVIKSECHRGSSLIQNLLLLVSADQKNWAVRKQNFELDEMLLHLFELYEPLCLAKNGKIFLELPEEPLPSAQADPELCRQIFTILLDNAIAYGLPEDTEHTTVLKHQLSGGKSAEHQNFGTAGWDPVPDRKKLILRAVYSHSHITVSVIDHGPGISDKEKKRIFDRFYRSDASRNKKEHFGLGLSIAAALAEIQNIRLEILDTEGGGSTFSVTINVTIHGHSGREL